MSLNQDDEFTPWAVAGSTSNAASNTEDPNDSSDHRQSLWADDVCDRGHPAATATSPHWLTQMSSIAENLWNDTQEEFGNPEWSFPSMDMNNSLPELLEGGDILDHGDEAWPIENNDDVGGKPVSTRIEGTQRIAPQAPSFTGIPSPTQGSEGVFLHNILNRQGGRQEALGPYTDGLLERVGSPEHGSESHVGPNMHGLTASYPYECSMLPDQMEIASPSLEDIRRQQDQAALDLDQTGELSGVAGKGAFIFMDQNHFDSLPRVTSNPPIASDMGRPFSDMASQTNTDTSGDTLACTCCPTIFTGKYRKGNLNRHCRHKHRDQIKMYSCGVGDCKKHFLRTDARLKHRRTKHSHLIANLTNSETSSSL